jgi:hypothetical protein
MQALAFAAMAETEFTFNVNIGGKRFENAAIGLQFLAARSTQAVLDLSPIARREMVDTLDTVVAAMRQRHSTRWRWGRRLPEGDAKGKLARRSGKSLATMKGKVKGGRDDFEGSITVPFPLSVHETGAVIRRRGKLLAIPLEAALTSSGVPKKRGPRAWRNTFVARSRRGNLLIFQKKPGGKIVPLYVLKERVRIPRRLGVGVTLEKAAPVYIERVFDKAVKALAKRGL